jgi:hypothetical protein
VFKGEDSRDMISERDILELVDAEIIDERTAESIRAYTNQSYADRPRFDVTHIGYYFGALIVMLAFAWFIFEGYDRYGGTALLMIAPSYALLFILAGGWLWKRPGLKIPGGLLYTLAVCMVPIAVYGFQESMGWFPIGNVREIADEAAKLDFLKQQQFCGIWIAASAFLAGMLAIVLRRFSYLAVPTVVGFVWTWLHIVMVMSGGQPSDWTMSTHLMLSGLFVLVVGFMVDRRTQEDFAFWVYLLGAGHFWIGLTSFPEDDELAWVAYVFVNLLMMVASILLQRRMFLAFGALGVFIYLGHLGFEVFQNSLIFPFVLSFIGLAIMGVAVWYQKHRQGVDEAVIGTLPESVRKRLPSARG